MNMRKKPMQSGGYSNQHKRPRYQGGGEHRSGGGGGGHNHSGGGNRPRRNYSASREKYLQQARDALASGDRVLAENYLQHAEHCYRMMVEEGFRPNQPRPAQQQGEDGNPNAQQETQDSQEEGEQQIPENTSQLPAFLTGSYEPSETKPVDPATVQNWEDRDAN